MSEFDKVIGYSSIKTELMQVCDMIHNPQLYKDMGARLPKGILLDGAPGLGKTLMATCFIKESGLETYLLRRDATTDNFMRKIKETFKDAKEYNGPAIVFLDDMDKFANEGRPGSSAEEYVAVQSGIDDVRGCDVLVIATVNDSDMLPSSLLRPGRFDRIINVGNPDNYEAEQIIIHYLRDKKLSKDVNLKDISMMMSYSSCAELEAMLNEAAIRATFARHSRIEMSDIVDSVLKMQYMVSDNDYRLNEKEKSAHALHEAGHLVVSEILCPGSIGFAALLSGGENECGGVVYQCRDYPDSEYKILVSLAGRAAVEIRYAENYGKGSSGDMNKACRMIYTKLTGEGMLGFGVLNPGGRLYEPSEAFRSHLEAVIQAELERYMAKTRDILIQNREFLEAAAAELREKETLLYSDIRRLRERAGIVSPPALNKS